jgi:hypothetical protein
LVEVAVVAAAGLYGVYHDLSFLSISGTTAIWEGTTSYTSPGGPGPGSCGSCPIRLEIDVSGLGGAPWVLEGSVTGLAAGIGAVVSTVSGAFYSVVPEPSMLMMLGMGIAGLSVRRRRSH